MATNLGWRSNRPKQLKKVAYAMTLDGLNKLIKAHEERGWVQASEIKKHGYGLGCLMIWGQESPLEKERVKCK